MIKMHKDDLKKLIKETVNETLVTLGVDPDDPQKAQANMAFLEKMRKGSEDTARIVKRSAIGAFVTAGLYMIWLGIQKGLGL